MGKWKLREILVQGYQLLRGRSMIWTRIQLQMQCLVTTLHYNWLVYIFKLRWICNIEGSLSILNAPWFWCSTLCFKFLCSLSLDMSPRCLSRDQSLHRGLGQKSKLSERWEVLCPRAAFSLCWPPYWAQFPHVKKMELRKSTLRLSWESGDIICIK